MGVPIPLCFLLLNPCGVMGSPSKDVPPNSWNDSILTN